MSITQYISAEVLKSEGFIQSNDKDGLIRAVVKQVPELGSIEIPAIQIANYLGVGEGRVYWYLKHKGLPSRLTIEQVLTTDWSELTDKDKPGDSKRKRTHIKF